MKFGGGHTWESQSTPEVTVHAAKAFANPPPSATRKAHRTLKEAERLLTSALDQSHLQEEIAKDVVGDVFISQVWRETGEKTFVGWLEKFGKSKSWAYKMLREYVNETFPQVEKIVDTKPDTESLTHDASPFVDSKTGQKLPHSTPADEPEKPHVQAATPEQMKTVSKPPMDESGAVIPQALLALRDRRQEVTGLEHHAATLRAFFERLQTDHDPLWASLKAAGSTQHFMNTVGTIRFQLAECTPDIVCPLCNGGNGKPCAYCCGSGWIAKVRWDREYVKSHDSVKLKLVEERAKNL